MSRQKIHKKILRELKHGWKGFLDFKDGFLYLNNKRYYINNNYDVFNTYDDKSVHICFFCGKIHKKGYKLKSRNPEIIFLRECCGNCWDSNYKKKKNKEV